MHKVFRWHVNSLFRLPPLGRNEPVEGRDESDVRLSAASVTEQQGRPFTRQRHGHKGRPR